MRTLVIGSKEVEKILKMEEVIKQVEKAFLANGQGKTIMPPKIYLPLEKGDFRAMPAYLEGKASLKWVNVHPDNPKEALLPTVMGVIIYSDPQTGFPLAIISGTEITDYRTGAAAAVASKYLARKEVKKLGLVGCGRQAQTQLLALSKVFKFEEILIFDSLKEKMQKFCQSNKDFPLKLAANLEEVANVDILSTVTPSRKPLILKKWIKPGIHINAIGADAPGKEELDPEILKEAKIVLDDFTQGLHSGEINVPFKKGIIKKEDIYGTLGEIVCGKKKGREKEEEITLFDSTGLAIQDLAVAELVYKRAKEEKLGVEVEMV